MSLTAVLRPDTGSVSGTPQPAADPSWYDAAWNQAAGSPAVTITCAILAALVTGLAVYALTRRPSKTDLGKRLMYAPLLLVNGAAVYGQVAFFYEEVAPHTWPTLGKVVLALVIALAIESVSVYVGWHAHDALLKKATNTAARLRRWSYLIAAGVAAINYAHFADDTGPLGINAAAVAFGMLSLLSPWLWGLHTRREQRVQLLREGRVDEAGATFSGERIRSFPIRSYLARRWSIDHYVTDPRQAWEGYNTELRTRWAVESTDQPGWWLRINPAARVRQLVAATTELRAITERQADAIADRDNRIADVMQALTAAHTELTETTAALDEATAKSVTADTSLRELTDQAGADREALIAAHETEKANIIAAKDTERDEALAKRTKELTDEFNAKLAAAKLTNLAQYRHGHPKNGSSKGPKHASSKVASAAASKQLMTDEEAVQAMLAVHSDPNHEWSDYAVRKTTGAGYGARIPRLVAAWREAATDKAADDSADDDSGEPWAVGQ